jgi:hypothetical protein
VLLYIVFYSDDVRKRIAPVGKDSTSHFEDDMFIALIDRLDIIDEYRMKIQRVGWTTMSDFTLGSLRLDYTTSTCNPVSASFLNHTFYSYIDASSLPIAS